MRKIDENLNRCKNLQMLKIKVDRNKQPPKCSRFNIIKSYIADICSSSGSDCPLLFMAVRRMVT